MSLKAAILGTQQTGDDARDILRQAGIVGFQRLAGYVSQSMGYDWGTHYFVSGLDAPICYALSDGFWVTAQIDSEFTIRYPFVYVWRDKVVLAWSDAAYINYEWRQLEITRDALIEMWSEKSDWVDTYNLLDKDIEVEYAP